MFILCELGCVGKDLGLYLNFKSDIIVKLCNVNLENPLVGT